MMIYEWLEEAARLTHKNRLESIDFVKSFDENINEASFKNKTIFLQWN